MQQKGLRSALWCALLWSVVFLPGAAPARADDWSTRYEVSEQEKQAKDKEPAAPEDAEPPKRRRRGIENGRPYPEEPWFDHSEWEWSGLGFVISGYGGAAVGDQTLMTGVGGVSLGATTKVFEWDILDFGGHGANFRDGGGGYIGTRARLYPLGRSVLKGIRLSPYLVGGVRHSERCETDAASSFGDLLFDIVFDSENYDSGCPQVISSLSVAEGGAGAELGLATRWTDVALFGELVYTTVNAGGTNAPAGRGGWEDGVAMYFGVRIRSFEIREFTADGTEVRRTPRRKRLPPAGDQLNPDRPLMP